MNSILSVPHLPIFLVEYSTLLYIQYSKVGERQHPSRTPMPFYVHSYHNNIYPERCPLIYVKFPNQSYIRLSTFFFLLIIILLSDNPVKHFPNSIKHSYITFLHTTYPSQTNIRSPTVSVVPHSLTKPNFSSPDFLTSSFSNVGTKPSRES